MLSFKAPKSPANSFPFSTFCCRCFLWFFFRCFFFALIPLCEEGKNRRERLMESIGIALWQGVTLCGIVSWIVLSSCLNVTQKLRSLVQPWVAHRVITGTSLILQIQVSTWFHHYKQNPHLLLLLLLLLLMNYVCVFCIFWWFLQNYQHGSLDALFSGLSCVVSVPFYTAFLPLLFWVFFSLPFSLCLVVNLDSSVLDDNFIHLHSNWVAFGKHCRLGMANWLGKWPF